MAKAQQTPEPPAAQTPADAAADQPTLRLVRDKPLDEVGPYKFERRRQPRWATSGRVTIVNYGQEEPGRASVESKRIGSLQLFDLSATGVGAWAQHEMPVGSRVAVFFPPRGTQQGFDRYGTVVRCEHHPHQGFDIGVQLDAQFVNAA